MPEGMDEIIDDFINEAEEDLEKIDPLFVELEAKGYSRELLNDIFRSMHTIKGAAGFLGFQGIVDVAHHTETLMKRLRDEELPITSSIISVILKSIDMLKLMLKHIKAKDGVEVPIADLLVELESAEVLGARFVAQAPGHAEQDSIPPQGVAIPEPSAVHPIIAHSHVQVDAAPAPPSHIEEEEPEEEPEEQDEQCLEEEPQEESQKDTPVVHAAAASASQGQAPSQTVQGSAAAQRAAAGPAAPGTQQKENVQTLRVDVERIDKVMNLTGEIVLVRNRLLNIGNFLEQKYPSDQHVEGLQETVSFLDLVTSDIQLAVMKMRMQPIKKVFGKFPRLVRDISQNMGKDVQLNISGEDTEVDRSVIERIGDPMVHIIRNAIDHGIEPIDERIKKGKPAKALVDISAYQQGNQILIEVSDDGRGINVERVKSKAVSKGLLTEEDAQRISDKEAINLVFLPGFSTIDVATDLSGRGVGMDVVKTSIAKLNGYVEVLTTKNVGTTIRISIPLTLAIIQALMVRTAGVQYAIPLAPIEETLKIAVKDIKYVASNTVLNIRDRVHPVRELTRILNQAQLAEPPEHRYVLVIALGERRFCVSVDELLGQEEVVIKAIEGIDTEDTGILGATITGEGKIVLILDPASMARAVSGISSL